MKVIIDGGEKRITLDNGEGCTILLEKGNTITCDNGKLKVVLKGEKCAVKNGSKSLFTILDTHFEHLIGMKTTGSQTAHTVSPDDIAKFTQDKLDLGQLLEA